MAFVGLKYFELFILFLTLKGLKDPGIKTSAKDGATAQTSEASDKDIDIISEVKEVLANLENTVMSDGPMNTIPTDVDYFMAMSTVPGISLTLLNHQNFSLVISTHFKTNSSISVFSNILKKQKCEIIGKGISCQQQEIMENLA